MRLRSIFALNFRVLDSSYLRISRSAGGRGGLVGVSKLNVTWGEVFQFDMIALIG